MNGRRRREHQRTKIKSHIACESFDAAARSSNGGNPLDVCFLPEHPLRAVIYLRLHHVLGNREVFHSRLEAAQSRLLEPVPDRAAPGCITNSVVQHVFSASTVSPQLFPCEGRLKQTTADIFFPDRI
jgi:hypothetical protein